MYVALDMRPEGINGESTTVWNAYEASEKDAFNLLTELRPIRGIHLL